MGAFNDALFLDNPAGTSISPCRAGRAGNYYKKLSDGGLYPHSLLRIDPLFTADELLLEFAVSGIEANVALG